MKKQHGFSIVEVLLIVVVVAVVGAVGYLAYTNLTKSDENVATDKKATTQETTITSVEDIDKTIEDIDSLPVEDSDLEELNAATEEF